MNKRVAVISELYGSAKQGGENIAMFRTAQALSNNNLDVDLYSYSGINGKKIPVKIPLRILSFPYLRDILFCPIIGLRLFKKINSDYKAVIIASPMLATYSKPRANLMIICHAIRTQKTYLLSKEDKITYRIIFNKLTRYIFRTMERKAYDRASFIFVLREHQKEFLVNEMGVDEKKIAIMSNGINTELFKPLDVKKQNQIIFVGRGTFPKGLDLLIDAADKIDSEILIVTQKINPQLLTAAKNKSNIQIMFNVNQEQLPELYSKSKIFVLPSRDEEQPLTVMEAMSSGIPVVVSKIAASNLVEDKINGLILAHVNSSELANSCNKLLHNKKLSSAIGATNRELSMRDFSFNKQVELLEQYI